MDGFFGIGIGELFTIAIVALVVLGPERLPGALRSVAKVIRTVREMTNELTSQFGDEFKVLEDLNPQKILNDLANDPDEKKPAAKKTTTAKKPATTTKPATKPATSTTAKSSSTAKSTTAKSPTTTSSQATPKVASASATSKPATVAKTAESAVATAEEVAVAEEDAPVAVVANADSGVESTTASTDVKAETVASDATEAATSEAEAAPIAEGTDAEVADTGVVAEAGADPAATTPESYDEEPSILPPTLRAQANADKPIDEPIEADEASVEIVEPSAADERESAVAATIVDDAPAEAVAPPETEPETDTAQAVSAAEVDPAVTVTNEPDLEDAEVAIQASIKADETVDDAAEEAATTEEDDDEAITPLVEADAEANGDEKPARNMTENAKRSQSGAKKTNVNGNHVHGNPTESEA